MEGMAQWAVVIPAERWRQERLFHHDSLTVPASDFAGGVADVAASRGAGAAGAVAGGAAAGDDVLLVAGASVVAVARVSLVADGAVEIGYVRRLFDAPVPADELKLSGTVTAVERDAYDRVVARVGGPGDRTTWLVSVALPIEAANPAEAVRQFWSHVRELGPAELPAYVWPSGDELAMQAFVLGAEANQDPEEDDD
jgi:hypothetical protein